MSTSWVIAIALTATGCGGETCGPEGAPVVGIIASGPGVSLTFGTLDASFANDCNPAEDVRSLTLAGEQAGGIGFFTLCIERPDQLGGGLALGTDDPGSPIHVIDVSGDAIGCTFRFDDTVPPAGTATGSGVCNGGDPAGFALVLDGTVSLERTCGATVDNVAVSLSGRVAVD